MTAEEVALEEFRLLAKCARDEMRTAKMMRAERDSDARWFFTMAREYRVQMKSLARIIRAIRAEREKDELAALESEVLACCGARRDGYERGRRDALRGVQGACWYLHGNLWLDRFPLPSSDERRAIAAIEIAMQAKAAEEMTR